MSSRNKNIFFLIFLVIFTILIYLPVLKGFFQHDEWNTFAVYLTDGVSFKQRIFSYFEPNVAHFAPFQAILFYLLFSIFKLNYTGYAIVSIFLQVVSVLLVYFFSSLLFKRKSHAFCVSLLYSSMASLHQATSWVGTTINTHGASIFALLSLTLFLKKKINLSLVFLFISLLFKEISIGVFAILLLITILHKKEYPKQTSLKIIFSALVYFIFRGLMIFAPKANIEERIVTESQSFLDIFNNFITFPAKIFSQSLIPTDFLLAVSQKITTLFPASISGPYGTTEFDIFSQNVVLQSINWVVFISAIFIIFKLFKSKDKKNLPLALFGFLFSVLNSFVYVLSPGRAGNIPVVDSRNIFFPAIGASIFLIAILNHYYKSRKFIFYIIFAPLIVFNLFFLEKELMFYARQGTERRNILNQIKKWYPILPDKTIVYTESDTSFYGMPEDVKILPFEINFGYTLMVWYLPEMNYDRELIKLGAFLYGIKDEGYLEVNGKGFGYFRNLDKLKDAISLYDLKTRSLFAIKYDSDKKEVVNISQEVSRLIENDDLEEPKAN